MRGCVRPSVGQSVRRSVGPSAMLLSAGKDEPANDLFRVYELVLLRLLVLEKEFMVFQASKGLFQASMFF